MAEDASIDLAAMMGFGHGQNKVYTHTFNPVPEPVDAGITDWKFSYDGEEGWRADISFETPEHAQAAIDRFREAGYEIVEE